jgi:thiol-disulfide isomerase/thioredoxin
MTGDKKDNLKPTELLADTPMLLSKDSKEVPTASTIDPHATLMFYFSASWCPPCARFTPELIKVYETLLSEGDKKVQVCFVSLDRDNASFDGYFKKMPWLAVPRTDPTIRRLASLFQVNSIPQLVVVAPDGRVLNHNAVQAVAQQGAGGFPWEQAEQATTSPVGGFSTFFVLAVALLVLLLPYLDQIRSKLGI